jgi:hypothetical protein
MQVALLSRDALNHFAELNEPYVVSLSSESDSFVQFSKNELSSSFELLMSLFTTQTKITLNEKNCQVFKFLSESLDNAQLLGKCQKITDKSSQIFKFSSKDIGSIPKKAQRFFNDFCLKMNGKSY